MADNKSKQLPKFLYHYSPKKNRNSILTNGLIGNHNGGRCIYLAENPDTWKSGDMDCYKVSTKNLNPSDFTSTGDNIDEVFYWGKTDGIIKIPKENIEQFLNSEADK